jgi:hypothetical protein
MNSLVKSIEERIAVFSEYKKSDSMSVKQILDLLEQIKKDAEKGTLKDICNSAGYFASKAMTSNKWYWFNDKLEKLSEGYFTSEESAYEDAAAKGNLDSKSTNTITKIELDHDFGMRGNRRLSIWYTEGKLTTEQACKYICEKLKTDRISSQCVSVSTVKLDKELNDVRGKDY